jgi:energy-coupling factor transporter ATP-binding protein EcfA2
MFLLITGASGAGKSTVREAVAPALAPAVESVELRDLVSIPAFPTVAWRQRATEAAVRRALELQADGRHLLLSGDPVAAGEVLATPSAGALDGIAVCLLDISAPAQTERLVHRGDDRRLLPHHHAFAEWMRGHARDPRHMPHVLTTNGWEAMRWDRLSVAESTDGSWGTEVVDASTLSRDQVAAEVLAWCHRALNADAPILCADLRFE